MKKALAVGLVVVSVACAEPTSPNVQLTSAPRVASVITAEAPSVVLPSAYASVMDPLINNNLPHSFRNVRYQQVFLGSELVDSVIVGLCLRRDEVPGGTERVQTLTIKLGPTALDHTNLGNTFDSNYSAPPTEVFTGDVLIPANVSGTDPANFDLCFPFTQEYLHTAGSNLIVEVLNTSLLSGNTPKDACPSDNAGCTTRRIWSLNAAATVAANNFGGGLVMKFISPEPPAPVDPVTIDECKKGGWANFGFRNQGLCIRLVETGLDAREEESQS